jgi:hypothetical protein
MIKESINWRIVFDMLGSLSSELESLSAEETKRIFFKLLNMSLWVGVLVGASL